jgi:tRNA dimethylallyltransferase
VPRIAVRSTDPVDRPTPSCVALVGPTGTGKTALALELAAALDAEIVNLDSRQVYRGLDIGSAKPRSAERARIPHHLFDVVAPDAPFNCARYRELALAAIADIRQRGRRVLLVGGTGLYLKVLRHGLFPGPPRDANVRAALAALEDEAPGALHAELARVDPDCARRLHPHDRSRLVRALEVWRVTGRAMSAWQGEHGFAGPALDLVPIGLTLDRACLYARINARAQAMVDAGLIEEIRALHAAGYGPEFPALASIGYRQIGAYLQGRCDLSSAIDEMAKHTRHLAKRQLTWFRPDPTIRWFDADTVRVHDVLVALGFEPVRG